MNTKIDKIFTEISAGELVDKITILEIINLLKELIFILFI